MLVRLLGTAVKTPVPGFHRRAYWALSWPSHARISTRRSTLAWTAHRSGNVGRDLRLSERAVIDAHLVDAAGKELIGVTVPTDLQRPGGGRQRRGLRLARHLHPIHVQPHRRPVEARRQMRPHV